MNMIRHQAISEDPQPRLVGRGAEPVQIDLAITVSEEHALMIRSALRNVMSHANGDGSSKSGHTE